MAGIYLHIPFCRKACDYCDFHFSTSLGLKERVVDAMCKEIEQRAKTWKEKQIQTIYFGGGTPSLLNEIELGKLIDAIKKNFVISADAEITFEANPDDITDENLSVWIKYGINRLSIGIQSFFDRDLDYMERIHSASEGENAVKRAQKAGIKNITIDLIYGTPGLSNLEWQENLQKAIDLHIPHISAYALTVEEGTPLYHRIKKKQKKSPNEDIQADQFLFMSEFLEQNGFEHYEVSNFGKPNMHSRHNSSYWDAIPYLGIGPSAHSYDGNRRRMNISNNAKYVAAFEKNEQDYFEEEFLTGDDIFNEYLLTRLRTKKGLTKEHFEAIFSIGEWIALLEELEEIPMEYLHITEESISLSREGLLHADGIAAELFR